MVDRDEIEAELVFVRSFNDDEGEEETLEPVTTPDGPVLERIGGQHQLLGWDLAKPDQLALLASMRASIDADEYVYAIPQRPHIGSSWHHYLRHDRTAAGTQTAACECIFSGSLT